MDSFLKLIGSMGVSFFCKMTLVQMLKFWFQRVKTMNYLNKKKIYELNNKIEKSIFKGEILSCKLDVTDIIALHEALMILQQLVRLKIIGFDEEGLVIKTKGIKNE